MQTNINPEEKKNHEISYKIRMTVDIKGLLIDKRPLRDDTGIEPFLQWAIAEIEERLGSVCDIIKVNKIELEQLN